MGFPPIDKSFAGLMRDTLTRLTLVERRLAISGGSVSWESLPPPIPYWQLPGRLLGTNLGIGLDANLLTDTGWYTGYGWTNAPVSTIAALEVIFYSPDWIAQTFTVLGDTSGRIFSRIRHSGTTWSGWQEVARQGFSGSPFRMAAGTIAIPSAIAAGGGLTVPITFPAGRFSVPPLLVGNASSTRLGLSFSAVTTSGANARVDNWTTATTAGAESASWTATQMLSGSAAG